jgi:hypothetical protein
MTNKTKRQSKELAHQFWGEQVKAWRISGVTQAQYCREHDLGLKSFGFWKGKLSLSSSKPVFHQVRIVPEQNNESGSLFLNLHVSSKYRIEVQDNFNPLTLQKLLKVLEGL